MTLCREANMRRMQASLCIRGLTLTTPEVQTVYQAVRLEEVLKFSPNQCVFYCFNSTGQGLTESLTSGAPLAIDKDPIRLLDLSGNELSNLSCLMDVSSLKRYIENLLRLDLSNNSLSEFPNALCQVCGNILTFIKAACR